MTDAELKEQFKTRILGFLRKIRLVYPIMKAQKWGRIVNITGGAGKEPDPYVLSSGITNSGLLNITKSLSTDFGEDNVLVNAICPGWVRPISGRVMCKACSRSWALSPTKRLADCQPARIR